mmetsp:Transcript_39622/g.60661  ORF Transcript_39622/g.60661 Transcript_39622/m.60661 type:complete len:211 (-) Transcript_39622:39-671(-)
MTQEVKSMQRLSKCGVQTPTVYLVDEYDRKIYMEYLGPTAVTLKDFLCGLNSLDHPSVEIIITMIAKSLAKMHNNDIVHGDLTTSNMMLLPTLPMDFKLANPHRISVDEILQAFTQNKSNSALDSKCLGELFLIDFGLSKVSSKVEDKGVDIYVLKRAMVSTHPGSEGMFDKILEIYKEEVTANNLNRGRMIITKFKEVEQRGRKRECFG